MKINLKPIQKVMTYRIIKYLMLSILIMGALSGCSQPAPTTKVVTLEEVEEPERKEVPATEDELDRFQRELQDEMRVFDVADYHDDLYALISAQVSGTESDETLNQIISPIADDYIDELLTKKIKEKLGENYSEADFNWLYAHVETQSLHKLMVAYEREYIKHKAK